MRGGGGSCLCFEATGNFWKGWQFLEGTVCSSCWKWRGNLTPTFPSPRPEVSFVPAPCDSLRGDSSGGFLAFRGLCRGLVTVDLFPDGRISLA